MENTRMHCTTTENKTKNAEPTWRAMNFLRSCFCYRKMKWILASDVYWVCVYILINLHRLTRHGRKIINDSCWACVLLNLNHWSMCMESHPGIQPWAVPNTSKTRPLEPSLSNNWNKYFITISLTHSYRSKAFCYFSFTHFIRSICQLSPKKNSKKTPKLRHRKLWLWIGAFVSWISYWRPLGIHFWCFPVGGEIPFSTNRSFLIFIVFCFHLIRPTYDTKWIFISDVVVVVSTFNMR